MDRALSLESRSHPSGPLFEFSRKGSIAKKGSLGSRVATVPKTFFQRLPGSKNEAADVKRSVGILADVICRNAVCSKAKLCG